MNISNIDSDLIEKQQQIKREQQTNRTTELPINSNQTLNLPTSIGQYQHVKKKVQENKQVMVNQQQKPIDELSTIKQQTLVNIEEQKLEGNAENVDTLALQKISRNGQQDLKKQNVQGIQSVQKIEQPNRSNLQKVDTQVISQTQNKEQQFTKIAQSRQFFMSIKSERSQVAILDQSSDNALKNNQGNKIDSDFPHQSSEVKAFNFKNRECKSENQSGNSSSEENQNKNLIKDKQSLNSLMKTQQSNPIELQKIIGKESKQTEEIVTEENKKQRAEKIAYQHAFIAAKTQQLVLDRKQDSTLIKKVQESVVMNTEQPAKQKKLNLISGNFSLGIDKQNILYEKQQKIDKAQTKVQPLDLRTLSVLTLSSPQGIKSIRPPSPKLSGQRKAKPWQKLKKIKTSESEPKQSIITNDNPLTQSAISRTVSSAIENTSKIEETSTLSIQKRFSESIKSQIIKPQQSISKVQRVQPSEQELKKDYPYITSVIQPSKINQNIIAENLKIQNQQQTQLFKEEQKLQKQTQQTKVEAKNQLNQTVAKQNELLVHQQAKNHPLLRHYPIQYKQISKQQALAEPSQINLQQKNIQIDSKDKQLPITNKDENKFSESEINALNEKLSEKKSGGSQIINDSSFQAKKSQNNVDIKKRLYQLQIQIQIQKKINEELQVSSTFERKLLLSLLAGLTAGSLTFFLRKDKLGSILLALATGVSTFIIKK